MEIISDDSLEFEEISSDSESEQVTRKSFRLPIVPDDAYFLEVGGDRFHVLDISNGGVCIAVQADTEFPEDARLSSCSLVLNQNRFENLEAEIVHISVDGDGNWVSGLQWIAISDEEQLRLETTIAELRKEFFENA